MRMTNLIVLSVTKFSDGKPGDHDREDVINLVKDLSDATKALPCNIILQGISCEEDVFRDKEYAVVHKGDYRGVEVAVTTVQEVDHTPHVSQVRGHHTALVLEVIHFCC
jgi:hypothetical protein